MTQFINVHTWYTNIHISAYLHACERREREREIETERQADRQTDIATYLLDLSFTSTGQAQVDACNVVSGR